MGLATRAPGCSGLAHSNHLLFSLENSLGEGCLLAASAQQHAALQAQLQLLEQAVTPLVSPVGTFHARLMRDVLLFRDILLAEEDEVDGVVLASKLTAAGYRVAVREAIGGGSGVAVFSNLRHSFLLVTAHVGSHAGVDFIVEPHFREQFEISQPTPRYRGLLELVPPVLVAPATQLQPLVQLLCAEMSLAFEHHGLSLPPWRQHVALLSKWLPSKARDYDLSPYASPRAASPLAPLPLAAIATAQPGGVRGTSEVPSGSATPGGFASDNSDGASPRAVLRSASALLVTHQSAQGGRGQGAAADGPAGAAPAAQAAQAPAPATLVRKSLLTSSLAPSRRGASPDGRSRASSPGITPGASPAAAAAAPAPSAVPGLLLGEAAVTQRGPSGLPYRVSAEWLQPAIRTVKMQGSQQAK